MAYNSLDHEFPTGYPLSLLVDSTQQYFALDKRGIKNAGDIMRYLGEHPDFEGIEELSDGDKQTILRLLEEAKTHFK